MTHRTTRARNQEELCESAQSDEESDLRSREENAIFNGTFKTRKTKASPSALRKKTYNPKKNKRRRRI